MATKYKENDVVMAVPLRFDKRKLQKSLRPSGGVAHKNLSFEQMNHDRWARRTLEWRPRENTRSRGRPPMRWKDDICRQAGYGCRSPGVEKWRGGLCPKTDELRAARDGWMDYL
ncbi:hypothetical protein MSG28_010380 [Choristoneura fumiferana]|uniref:Uncharacterized protein n=1 Tax=Choristoneura fumiferana TaxID=7141 RepID=A0ACC0KKL2_CHOFU|nr:hypothetical protein MSG28_010380 [Choristoneura fumiferana]